MHGHLAKRTSLFKGEKPTVVATLPPVVVMMAVRRVLRAVLTVVIMMDNMFRYCGATSRSLPYTASTDSAVVVMTGDSNTAATPTFSPLPKPLASSSFAKVLEVGSRTLPAPVSPFARAINVGTRTVSQVLPPIPSPESELVGGVVHVDDSFLRMETAVGLYAGTKARTRYQMTALLDSGSFKTVIREDVVEEMKAAGAADETCEFHHSHKPVGSCGFGGWLMSSKSVLLSVQLYKLVEGCRIPSAVLSVWATIAPAGSMGSQKFILGRDSCHGFSQRTYRRTYPIAPGPQPAGELALAIDGNAPAGESMTACPLWCYDPRVVSPS